MQGKRVLFVTTDITPGKICKEIAEELRQRESYISVVADGASRKIWEDVGYPTCLSYNLVHNQVDVVVVGTSSPKTMGIEQSYAKEANDRGIPLVVIEDIMGGLGRLSTSVKPDLVLCSTEAARLQHHDRGLRAIEIGSVNAVWVNPAAEVAEQVKALRKEHGMVVFYAAQLVWDDLQLLLNCMAMSTPKGCLIAGLHPDPAKRVHADKIQALLDGASRIGVHVAAIDAGNDQIMTCCDMVASGYSGMLEKASYNERITISLGSEDARAMCMKETGLTLPPQVSAGLSYFVSGPAPLEQFSEPRPGEVYHLDICDAVSEIEDLVP